MPRGTLWCYKLLNQKQMRLIRLGKKIFFSFFFLIIDFESTRCNVRVFSGRARGLKAFSSPSISPPSQDFAPVDCFSLFLAVSVLSSPCRAYGRIVMISITRRSNLRVRVIAVTGTFTRAKFHATLLVSGLCL
ncbi:hypothetical protein PUN28_013286 [Cardiocondyla obscurior]|uniref:Uncharacterized protein n=1 Tax=Cardiocondyla obscurior TaxID=286306 RepID=A0AAW2FDC1_9HYME